MEDHCPHRGGPLSQGIVHGAAVTCPLHNWVISLETGKALGADEGAVRTIPVKVEGERLFIALEARAVEGGMTDMQSEQAREVRTTCPYCGVGCGVLAKVAADGEVAVRGDPDHPANFGRLCSKGSALGETLDLDGRLLHPRNRRAARRLGRGARPRRLDLLADHRRARAGLRSPSTSPANC